MRKDDTKVGLPSSPIAWLIVDDIKDDLGGPVHLLADSCLRWSLHSKYNCSQSDFWKGNQSYSQNEKSKWPSEKKNQINSQNENENNSRVLLWVLVPALGAPAVHNAWWVCGLLNNIK